MTRLGIEPRTYGLKAPIEYGTIAA